MNVKRWFAVFAVLSVAVAAVIFSMSFQSREDSGAASSGLVALLKPILDPRDKIPEESFHHYVRKAAHFTEFAALGVCVGGMAVSLGKMKNRRYFALPMLLTLSTAVCDEFIQYFTGRGSMVTDVVLDFSGSLFGLGLAACFALVLFRSLAKKAEKLRRARDEREVRS